MKKLLYSSFVPILMFLTVAPLKSVGQEVKELSKYKCNNGWQLGKNGYIILGYPNGKTFKTINDSVGNGLSINYKDSALKIIKIEKFINDNNLKVIYCSIATQKGVYRMDVEQAIALYELQVPSKYSKASMTTDLKARSARYDSLISEIPFKDGKIFYDNVVEVKGKNKDEIFTMLREWIVENFIDSKSVLEVNDKEDGRLTGKGTYRYFTTMGLNSTDGWITFIINIAVKDGKFRYQVYDFSAKGTRTDFDLFSPTGQSKSEDIFHMDDMWRWYNDGNKRQTKEAKQHLSKMVWLTEYIDFSITRIGREGFNDISDF